MVYRPYELNGVAQGLPDVATIFVECTEVDLSPETKMNRSRPFIIRLPVVSKTTGGRKKKCATPIFEPMKHWSGGPQTVFVGNVCLLTERKREHFVW